MMAVVSELTVLAGESVRPLVSESAVWWRCWSDGSDDWCCPMAGCWCEAGTA